MAPHYGGKHRCSYRGDCLRIIDHIPGPGTGDVIYRAEDGSLWREVSYWDTGTRHTELRHKIGDCLCDPH